MATIRNYRDLVAWQKAIDLADHVMDFADTIEHPRRFALVNQLRRSAISIPSNIAEGYGRRSRGDYIRFVRIANGSLRELETQILLAARRSLAVERTGALLESADEVGRLLTGLDRYLTSQGGRR